MNDQLVSFETAKLAKEKGFDEEVICIFNPIKKNRIYLRKNVIYKGGIKVNLGTTIGCSTQSLLQRWLREKHNIHVSSECNFSGWFWNIEKTDGTYIKLFDLFVDGHKANTENGHYKTYEEALEIGLQEALKLI
jgi:hypothetical protein